MLGSIANSTNLLMPLHLKQHPQHMKRRVFDSINYNK